MTTRWTPIAANRGSAMLINGHRIGMYATVQHDRRGGESQYYGVAYLLLTEAEVDVIHKLESHSFDFEITYFSRHPPTIASMSRALIESLAGVSDDRVWYMGTTMEFQSTPIPLLDIQARLIHFSDWVDSCVTQS